MKVLHVIPSLSPADGGPSVALPRMVRSLVGAGIEVDVATTEGDGAGQHAPVELGTRLECDGWGQFFFKRQAESYKISFPLRRWLPGTVHRYDVIHIHALFSFSSTSAARTAYKLGVPYVIRPLGVLNRWGMENRRRALKRLSIRLIELPILRHAAAIHYASEAERSEALAVHPEIADFPSFVIPIPIARPSEQIDRAEFARRFPDAEGKRVILFLSRLDPKKGVELLLNSFANVSQDNRDLLLVIAGDGLPAYAQSVKKLAEELQISGRVLWTGHLGEADKAAAFAAATIFVLPSYSENFGIAAAEALAAGVPSVLSDQVAMAADARNAGAALVVEPKVEEISSAMACLIDDKALRGRLSVNGVELVRKRYSPEAVGEALAEQYRRIVARAGSRS